MSKRKHIGPAHSPYPAGTVSEHIGYYTFKVLSAIACTALWSGAYYVILGVVVVIAGGGNDESETGWSVEKLLQTTAGKWIWIIVSLIVFITVLRSKIGARNKRDTKKAPRVL